MNVAVFLTLFVLVGCQNVITKPYHGRVKRFSDQHLADLETRIALNTKYKGVAITFPIGGGKYGVDPWKLGRKRRSEPETVEQLFRTSSAEDDVGDPPSGGQHQQLLPLNYDELLFLAKIGLMSLRQHYQN